MLTLAHFKTTQIRREGDPPRTLRVECSLYIEWESVPMSNQATGLRNRIENSKRRQIENAFHYIYGELADEIHALQREVLPRLQMGTTGKVERMFGDLLKKLEGPR